MNRRHVEQAILTLDQEGWHEHAQAVRELYETVCRIEDGDLVVVPAPGTVSPPSELTAALLADLRDRYPDKWAEEPRRPTHLVGKDHWVWCGLCAVWVSPHGACRHGITGGSGD